jgi:hypothetical protein
MLSAWFMHKDSNLSFGWNQWTWQHTLRIDVPPKPSIQHYHKKCGLIGGMMHSIWKILVAKLMHIFQIRKGIKYNLVLCMFLGYFEVTKPFLLDVCQVQENHQKSRCCVPWKNESMLMIKLVQKKQKVFEWTYEWDNWRSTTWNWQLQTTNESPMEGMDIVFKSNHSLEKFIPPTHIQEDAWRKRLQRQCKEWFHNWWIVTK